MLITLRQVLRFPLSNALSGGTEGGHDGVSALPSTPPRTPFFAPPAHKGKLPIEQIKQRMELVLHDAQSVQVARLRYKIRATRDVGELWMLRSDMYQVIATLHSQSEAARRINSLLPSFSQWISAKQLSAV